MTGTGWYDDFSEAVGDEWDDPVNGEQLDRIITDAHAKGVPWQIPLLFHYAALIRNVSAVAAILARGVAPCDPGGHPPLHAAAFQIDGYFGAPLDLPRLCVDRLIAGGAEVEERDELNRVPLTEAVGGDGVSLIGTRALLQHGANPSECDREGETILMRAVRERSPRAVALLLRYGAELHARDAEGKTALDRAEARLDRLSSDDSFVKKSSEPEDHRPPGVAEIFGEDASGRLGEFEDPPDEPERDSEYLAEVRAWAADDDAEASGLDESLREAEGMKLRCIISLISEETDR